MKLDWRDLQTRGDESLRNMDPSTNHSLASPLSMTRKFFQHVDNGFIVANLLTLYILYCAAKFFKTRHDFYKIV